MIFINSCLLTFMEFYCSYFVALASSMGMRMTKAKVGIVIYLFGVNEMYPSVK